MKQNTKTRYRVEYYSDFRKKWVPYDSMNFNMFETAEEAEKRLRKLQRWWPNQQFRVEAL